MQGFKAVKLEEYIGSIRLIESLSKESLFSKESLAGWMKTCSKFSDVDLRIFG